MAAAQFLYAEDNADTAGSAHPTYVDSASIAAASFTANKEYLILANMLAECGAGGASEYHAQLVHGTTPTAFTDADAVIDPGIGATGGTCLSWMYRFTQPGTTELVKLQVAGEANAMTSLGSQIFALKLSDDFTENTDFFWNEVTADYTTTASHVSQASVTFTPNGTDDWLIIAHYCQGLPSALTTSLGVEIFDDVTSSAEPALSVESEDIDAGDENRSFVLSRVFTPSNAAHTFSIRFWNIGANTYSIFSSRIIAIKLNKFNQHFNVFTSAADTPSTSPTFETEATASVTPSVTGDWFYWGSHVFDVATATGEQNIRMQDDNTGSLVSDPAYGDNGVNGPAWDATDDIPLGIFKMKSLTSGASRTVNYDVTTISGTGTAKQRSLWGFSAELASAAVTPIPDVVMAPYQAA